MNQKWQCWVALVFVAIVFGVAGGVGVCLLKSGSWGEIAIISLATLIVLTATLVGVFWYAAAARRQAEILKDQFDVQYTPHLRPAVRCPEIDSKSVIIRLRNLAGAAAIHPGVYPEWLPGKQNAELVRESDYDPNDPNSCLPAGDNFTLPVMKAGLEGWLCRVAMPPYGSGKVKVAWGEYPWGERDRWIWRLELISKEEEEKGWHFVCKPEDNKPPP